MGSRPAPKDHIALEASLLPFPPTSLPAPAPAHTSSGLWLFFPSDGLQSLLSQHRRAQPTNDVVTFQLCLPHYSEFIWARNYFIVIVNIAIIHF